MIFVDRQHVMSGTKALLEVRLACCSWLQKLLHLGCPQPLCVSGLSWKAFWWHGPLPAGHSAVSIIRQDNK